MTHNLQQGVCSYDKVWSLTVKFIYTLMWVSSKMLSSFVLKVLIAHRTQVKKKLQVAAKKGKPKHFLTTLSVQKKIKKKKEEKQRQGPAVCIYI